MPGGRDAKATAHAFRHLSDFPMCFPRGQPGPIPPFDGKADGEISRVGSLPVTAKFDLDLSI